MNEEHRTPMDRRPVLQVVRYLFPLVLVGLGVHILLPQIATAEHSLQVIRDLQLWAVAVAVTMQVLSYLGSGYLLRALVAVGGQRLAVLRGTAIFTAATSVALLGGGPVGSIATTYRWMRASGVAAEAATLAGWLPTVFTDATLASVSVFGLAHLLVVHELSTIQVAAFAFTILTLLVVTGGVAWGMHHRARVTTAITRLERRWTSLLGHPYDTSGTEAAVGRWFGAWDTLRAGGWRGPLLGATINTVFDMLTLYLLFVAAGHTISPGVLLAGYGLPLLLGKLSFLPGGIGIVEATMTALYNGLGVPAGVTVVVVLAYRFLSFWLPLVLGLPLIAYLQRVSRKVGINSTG